VAKFVLRKSTLALVLVLLTTGITRTFAQSIPLPPMPIPMPTPDGGDPNPGNPDPTCTDGTCAVGIHLGVIR
jgi:hypothetical protein